MKTTKESLNELDHAWNELLMAIGLSLKLDLLVSWISKQLNKFK